MISKLNYSYYLLFLIFVVWSHQLCAQFPKIWEVRSDKLENTSLYDKLNFQKRVENDSVWQSELSNMEQNLKETGYLRMVIRHETRDSVIYTKIILGEKIDWLVFQYPEVNELSKIYSLKINDANTGELSFEKTVDFLEFIKQYYEENGFPFVKVFLSQHQLAGNKLHAVLNIEKGAPKKIDKILVKGYDNFPISFVKNKLQLSENQLYNKNILDKISQRIQQIPFVSEIRKPEVLFTQDSTYIYLYLDKVKSQNTIDGLIGFSNSENAQKLQLNGHLDLKLLNVLDKGEQMSLNWLSTGNQTQSLTLQLAYPYLLKTPISLHYALDMYKRDTTFLNVENKLALGYDIGENQQLGVEGKFIRSNTLYRAIDLDDYSARFYGIYYQYRMGNRSKWFPDTFYAKSNVLKGKRQDLSQWQFNWQLAYYYTITQRSVVELKNTSGFLISDEYLTNEIYHVGGPQSIRGFLEKSLKTDKFSIFNFGYNFLTSDQSYLSVYTDLGILKVLDMGTDFLYSPGLGYTLETKSSILTLQYFIGNHSKTSFSFKNSIFTIGFSQKI